MVKTLKTLFSSRKFVIAFWDAVVSTLAFILSLWLAPDKVGSILGLIAVWQPILIALIVSIAHEDGKAYDNFSHPNSDPIVEPPESGEPAE